MWLLLLPMAPVVAMSHTRWNPPSNMRQVSVPLMVPPGPIGPGRTFPSSFQLPTKRARFLCSTPGFSCGGCADRVAPRRMAVVQSVNSFLMGEIVVELAPGAGIATGRLGEVWMSDEVTGTAVPAEELTGDQKRQNVINLAFGGSE